MAVLGGPEPEHGEYLGRRRGPDAGAPGPGVGPLDAGPAPQCRPDRLLHRGRGAAAYQDAYVGEAPLPSGRSKHGSQAAARTGCCFQTVNFHEESTVTLGTRTAIWRTTS